MFTENTQKYLTPRLGKGKGQGSSVSLEAEAIGLLLRTAINVSLLASQSLAVSVQIPNSQEQASEWITL